MRSQGSGHAASCRGVLGPWGTCLVAGWGLRAEVGALMKVQGGVELVVRWPGHPGPWAPLGLIWWRVLLQPWGGAIEVLGPSRAGTRHEEGRQRKLRQDK